MTERLGLRNTHWDEFKDPRQFSPIYATGISNETFQQVSDAICEVPDDFTMHRQVSKLMHERGAMLSSGEGINWGTAEALAFGSLLLEGRHVRITGQDVERGTFSHRHAVLHDQTTGTEHTPLATLGKNHEGAEDFVVSNSHLSECVRGSPRYACVVCWCG